jgi:hypothetical protein
MKVFVEVKSLVRDLIVVVDTEETALEIRIHISFNTIKYVLYHLHYTSEYARFE